MATPVETVIQQILDDNLGPGAPQLYCPVSPGFMVTEYTPEYVSVWDALQTLVAQFGGWIGYKWIPDYNDFRLTLLIPPRGKDAASADWTLDARQIIVQHLDISDRDIRNAVLVTYRDINSGKRETTGAFDSASILEFGRRAMQIEEADTSLIDTLTEAMALADAVLHDLKDITATTRLILPFLPTLDVFDGILVTNPRLSSTQDFYGVESVEHILDFDRGQFRTEVVASGRVVGAHTRWLLMETRPGSPGKPIDMPPPFTVIVAAEDSPMEEREKAQYFCDGVDDQEQINAAIQSLGAAGGTVQLLQGSYNVSASVLIYSNATLRGQGAGTVIRAADETGPISIIDQVAGSTQIAVKDLVIDGNKAGGAEAYGTGDLSSCTIQGVVVRDCYYRAISIDGPATVSACTITGCQTGIIVREGAGIIVTNNNVYSNTNEGIEAINTVGANISNNIVEDNGETGIALNNISYCSVTGNTCKRNGRDGIYLRDSSDNNVSGNTCTENGQAYQGRNIHISEVSGTTARNTVQYNLCRAGSLTAKPIYGIDIDGDYNLVANNDCYQGGEWGGLSDIGTGTCFGAGNRKGNGTWGVGSD